MKPPDKNVLENIGKVDSVGFVIKHHHEDANILARKWSSRLLREGYEVVFSHESINTANACKRENGIDPTSKKKSKILVVEKTELPLACSIIVVFGGDGTLISIARLMKTNSVPVFGVNMGQLGFLTEIRKEDAESIFWEILESGKARISHRRLLDITVRDQEKIFYSAPVVNDAVISKGEIARIFGLDIFVDGRWVNTVRADGVIVSTPTGSTAYSLAAGGPILEPGLPCMVITPICPHSLTQRPFVLSDTAIIEMRLSHRPGKVILTLDGQDMLELQEQHTVEVKAFEKHSLKLIRPAAQGFYDLLRAKLKFGERA